MAGSRGMMCASTCDPELDVRPGSRSCAGRDRRRARVSPAERACAVRCRARCGAGRARDSRSHRWPGRGSGDHRPTRDGDPVTATALARRERTHGSAADGRFASRVHGSRSRVEPERRKSLVGSGGCARRGGAIKNVKPAARASSASTSQLQFSRLARLRSSHTRGQTVHVHTWRVRQYACCTVLHTTRRQ